MKFRGFKKELSSGLYLLKNKGVRYTYNHLWLRSMYGRTPVSRLFYGRLFPIFGHRFPKIVEIEVTTRCHLKCVMCEHEYWTEKGQDMSFEQFKSIIDQFPKLRWIGLTGIGTAFLNKDFIKILRYIKSRSNATLIELFDTFHLITEDKARELVDIGVDFMFASIDGATKETYEKIRVGSNFEKVLEHFGNIIRIKKETGSHFPEIGVHYIISKDNVHEVPQFVNLIAERFGSENIDHIFFTGVLHEFDAIKGYVVNVPEDIIRKADENAKKHSIRITWNKNVPALKPPMKECTVWIEPFIFVDGSVIQCCASNEGGRRDYQRANSFGNVFEKSFKDIWNGPKYREFRNSLHKGIMPPQCRFCTITNPECMKKAE